MNYIGEYTLIDTPKKMDRFIRRMEKNPAEWRYASLDTEYDGSEDLVTDGGVNRNLDKIELAFVQLCNGREVIVIDGPITSDARYPGKGYNLPLELKPWFAGERWKKIVSTYSAERQSIRDGVGVDLQGVVLDTEVADWMLDENRLRHGLKDAAADHVDFYMKSYKETFGFIVGNRKTPIVPGMRDIVRGSDGGAVLPVPWTGAEGRKKAEAYAAKDAVATWLLYEFYRKALKREDLWDWYQEVERHVTLVLANMADRGLRINPARLRQIAKTVHAEMLRSEHTFKTLVEEPEMNVRSNPQLQKVIFEKLDWPVLFRNKVTPNQRANGQTEGSPSLNATALEAYAKKGYRPAQVLRAYNSHKTLHGTFLKSMLEKADADGRVFTIFWQTRTDTGRVSSGNAKRGLLNFMNFPARKDKDPHGLRRFILANREDYSLIVGDYAQIELYILAQLGRDERMIQAFNRGEDLHSITTAGALGLSLPKAPTKWDKKHPDYTRWAAEMEAWKERHDDKRTKYGKGLNFGVSYGITKFKVAGDLGISEDEAQQIIDNFFSTYPGVKAWLDANEEFLMDHGYVMTVGGRRRRLPGAFSNDVWEVRRAQRQASNFPIQGTAAEIMKVAMCAIELGPQWIKGPGARWIRDVSDEVLELSELEYRILAQVHDELVGECPTRNADRATELVQTVMEAAYEFFFEDISLKASVHAGPDWYEGKHGGA